MARYVSRFEPDQYCPKCDSLMRWEADEDYEYPVCIACEEDEDNGRG